LPLLEADDLDVVTEAVLALAAIGPKAGSAVGPLVSLLEKTGQAEEQSALRYALIYALGRIGPPDATPALESLSALSTSADEMAATLATWASLQIDPDNKERYADAVPLLAKGLESESQTVRLEAAVALGDLGPNAAAAAAALELVAEDDPIADIRAAARQALAKIGS
jgi:HEAT repeat protein